MYVLYFEQKCLTVSTKKKSDFSDVTLKESTLLCIFFYLMAKIALDYFKIIKFQSLKEYERRTQLNLD